MESKYFLKSLKSDNWHVNGLAFSPDGKFFVSTTWKVLTKWDLINRTWKVLLRDAELMIYSAAISPNSKFICARGNNSVTLLDLAGNIIRTFGGQVEDDFGEVMEDRFLSFAFSPDGLKIFSAGNGFITLWDVQTGACLNTIKIDPDVDNIERGEEEGASFFHNSDKNTTWIATVYSLNLVDALTGKFFKNQVNRSSCEPAFSPDGKMVCSSRGVDIDFNADFNLQLYKTETYELIKEFTGHTRGIRCVAFSPDGKWICTGSEDKTVRLWSLTGKDPIILTGHKSMVFRVAFSPKKDIILSGSSDGEIIMWANPEVTQSDRTAPIFSQLLGIDLMKPTGDTRSDPLAGNLQRLPPELRSLIAGYLPLKDIV
jgi:WD40 repeat protein